MSYYSMPPSYSPSYPSSSQDTRFPQGGYVMIPLPWYDTTSDTPHDQYDPFGAGYDVQPQQSDHSQQWDYAQQSDYSQQPDFSQLSSAPHDPVAFATSSNTSRESYTDSNNPGINSCPDYYTARNYAAPISETGSVKISSQRRSRARQTLQGTEPQAVGPQRSAKDSRPQQRVGTPYEPPRTRSRATPIEAPQPVQKEKKKSNSFMRYQQDIRQALDPKTYALDRNDKKMVGKIDQDYWTQLYIRDEKPAPEDSVACKFRDGQSPFELVPVRVVTEALRILVRCAVDKVFDPHMNETRVKRKRIMRESLDDVRIFKNTREAIWVTWREWAKAPDAGELPPIFAPQDVHRTRRDLREFGLDTHHVQPVLPPVAAPVAPPVPQLPALAPAVPYVPSASSSQKARPRPSRGMALSTGYFTPATW